jgi:hypothetical protein
MVTIWTTDIYLSRYRGTAMENGLEGFIVAGEKGVAMFGE